jgi:hypothetical protein
VFAEATGRRLEGAADDDETVPATEAR